jgi:hypothetical protein
MLAAHLADTLEPPRNLPIRLQRGGRTVATLDDLRLAVQRASAESQRAIGPSRASFSATIASSAASSALSSLMSQFLRKAHGKLPSSTEGAEILDRAQIDLDELRHALSK